jgi:hypothetical protein
MGLKRGLLAGHCPLHLASSQQEYLIVEKGTHEINVEVEAEHIGIIIGITPNSDRELGYTVLDGAKVID